MVTRESSKTIRISVIVGIVTLLVYLGSLSCGFINLDDPFYITNNPLIKSMDIGALFRIFTEAHLGAWIPLTYLSFAVDYHFWGNNPAGYHLTNILLHAVNAALVVILAERLCRDEAVLLMADRREGGRLNSGMLLVAGLLFALHPLRVESVAWASERKDVLNGFFTISAVIAYCSYVRIKEAGGGARRRHGFYLSSLLFFSLSLMAKQVSVTLPVILLLLDWYPLGRMHKGNLLRLLVEKVPFFLISLCITLATLYFANAEKMLLSMASMPFSVRLAVSGNALFEYCRLSIFPIGISPYFVLPNPLPYVYPVKAVLIAAFTLLLVRYAICRRGLLVVWICFVITLLPMLAFLQSGDDIALAARYTYLPAIAPAIGVAAFLAAVIGKWLVQGRLAPALTGIGLVALFLVGSTAVTMKLIKVWENTGTFWSRVIEMNPVGRAYGDRGVYYLINGRCDEALHDFNEAIEIAVRARIRTIYNLYAFRGVALSDCGRYADAVADFDRAISLYPHPTYFHLRGIALQSLGRESEATEAFRRAGSNPPPIDWFQQ